MRVSDVMTREVETVAAEMDLMEAAEKMRRRNVGFLPVVEHNAVIGVITDRDIVLRGLGEKRIPQETIVKDVMTPVVFWCYQDDVLTEAAIIMEEALVRRLVVLDSNKNVVGLLSLDDLAAHMSSDRLLGLVLRNIAA